MPAKHLQRAGAEGIYCHIYNKGIENRIIFNAQEDYDVFLGFLKDYLSAPKDPETTKTDFSVNGRIFRGIPHQPKNYFNKVELIAYSLLPDHFHLLLHQLVEGALESLIRSLCTRYSVYFNKKYQRTGSLLAGPYKSVRIGDLLHLVHLSRYIHHAGSHTSYKEFLESNSPSWLNPKPVLTFFHEGKISYKDFVEKEKSVLSDSATIDTERDHLEKSILASNQAIETSYKLNSRVRTPVFLATSGVVFLLLVTLGVRNIQATAGRSSQLPSVLGEIVTVTPQPTEAPQATTQGQPEASSSAEPEITAEATASASHGEFEASSSATSQPATSSANTKSASPAKVIVGAIDVNIFQEATSSAKRVGLAQVGDKFEVVSAGSDWYEVKLPNGSTGFISSIYIQIDQNDQ